MGALGPQKVKEPCQTLQSVHHPDFSRDQNIIKTFGPSKVVQPKSLFLFWIIRYTSDPFFNLFPIQRILNKKTVNPNLEAILRFSGKS